MINVDMGLIMRGRYPECGNYFARGITDRTKKGSGAGLNVLSHDALQYSSGLLALKCYFFQSGLHINSHFWNTILTRIYQQVQYEY